MILLIYLILLKLTGPKFLNKLIDKYFYKNSTTKNSFKAIQKISDRHVLILLPAPHVFLPLPHALLSLFIFCLYYIIYILS